MNPRSKTYCRVPSLAFIVATVALCSLFSPTVATAQIAAWNFFGDNGATNVTRAATTFNSNLDSTNLLTRGAGAAASSGTNSFRTTGFQNNGIAVANTDYFQFALSAAAGFALNVTSISANLAGTATFSAAPGASNQFAYSLDGVNFTLIGAPSVRTGDGGIGPIDTASISALQNVASGTTVTFRFFASGQTATGGWGFSSPNASTAGLSVSGSLVVDNPNAPQISDFSPQAGVAGTAVTIFGTNFTGATSVTFGTNTAVAAFTVGSATNIQATVPSGAITGVITVATPNGTNTSAQTFLILDGSGTATVQNGTAPYAGKNIFPRNTSGQTLQVVYTPPASGTIEGLRIEVPAAFGAPLVGNVSVSGGGGSPSPSVSGQFVTVTGLAATSASNVTVSISGLTMPDTSTPITTTGANLVNVQSRGSGGTFAAIASSPSALVTIPLANVRNYDANFSPVLSNTVVAVQGTANVGKLANRGINASIQDSDWGVVFDASSAVAVSNLVRGNNYAAIGRVTQFQGVVQVTLTNVADLLDLGAGVNPAAVVATVSQFTNTNTAPTFQSRVVRIDNLNKLSGTWAVSNNVILTNSSGEQITVFIPFGSTATTEPVYPVNVTGIGGQSNAAAPFTGGWRIQPRDPADLTSATLPSIGVNPTSLTNLTATQDNFGPSTNFVVNASNLSNNITVTANDAVNFAISTNNTDFTSTLSLPTNSSGAVTNASVFVRLTGAAPDGAKSNTVTLASDATVTNVIVTGTVAAQPTPTVTAAPTNVGPLQSLQGSPSPAPYGTYVLSGTAITNGVNINAAAGLEVSFTNTGGGFSSSLSIPTAPPGGTFSTNIFVRVASAASLGGFTRSITNSTIGGTNDSVVQVTGEVLPAGAAAITPANGTTFSGFTATRPAPSTNQQISVSGENLPANITITPPAGWEISATNSNNPTTNSIVLATNPAGIVSATPLFIRMASSPVATNYTNSILRLVSGTNTNSITLLGTVNNPPPVLTLSTNTLTNFSTLTNTFSASTNFTVSGTNLTSNVTVTPPTGWQVSPTNTSNFSSNAITIGTNAGGGVNASVFLRIGQVAAATTFNTNVRVESGATVTNLIAVGSVTSTITAPTITSFTPTNGPRGTWVTINGSSFGTTVSNGVSFGGVASTNVSIRGANEVRAAVPSPGAQTGRITLSNAVGIATSSINFTIDPLTLRVPPVIRAGVATPVRISIPSPVLTDTVITLQGNPAQTVRVPATVTIPAGQTYALFSITPPSGINANGTVAAVTANYVDTSASITVSTAASRAASFMEEGYLQDFATFTNQTTLPYGWSVSSSTTPFVYSPWGTPTNGFKYSTETVGVFGYQHTSSGTASQILALRNDTATNVTQIRITYTGRTTNASNNIINRFPAYAVTVTATNGTNTFRTNSTDLNYSTLWGDSYQATAKLVLTNTNAGFTNGVPAWTNFVVTWESDADTDGTDGSAQIGLGDLTVELVKPYVQLTPEAGNNDFITTSGTPSVPRFFWVSGQDLTGNLVVSAPANFEISRTNLPNVFTNQLTFTPTAGTVAPIQILARIRADAPQAPQTPPATVAGDLSATSTNATPAMQPISGVVFAPGSSTQVLASPEALTNFSAIKTNASAAQFFYASGVNLSNNMTVSATAGFQISLNETNGFATGFTIDRDAFGRVAPTLVYVRLAPSDTVGVKSGTVDIASGTASDTVQLGGTVDPAPPFINITGSYTNFGTNQRGSVSIAQTNGKVSAANLVAPLTLAAPEGFQISTNGSAYVESISFSPTNGVVPTNTIWVRIAAYAYAADPLSGNLTAQSPGAVPRSWGLTGAVVANSNPWISARPSTLSGFIARPNTSSDAQTFTVEAANIGESLRVVASDKYEISMNGVVFTNVISLARVTNGTGGGGGGGTRIIASDNGANYPPSGPATGTNLGTGFGPWTVVSGTTNGGFAGTFVGNPTAAGIGGMSANSFGLFAAPNPPNPPTNADFVNVSRNFSNSLKVGDSFSFQWGNNYDSGPAGNKGFNLTTPAGSNIFNLNMAGNAAITLAQGTNAATVVVPGYGTNAMTFTFARTASNTFTVSAPAGRSNNSPGFTNVFTVTNEAAGFAFYASGLQNDGNPTNRDSAQPYFNNLQVTEPFDGAPGDVPRTDLFVRLKAQAGTNAAVDGVIDVSGAPAFPTNIVLSGRVPPPPAISPSPTNLTGFVTTAGIASAAQSFTVSAQTLGGALNIAAPSGFEISLVSTNGFGSSLALAPTNEAIASTTIFVRFAATATAADYTNSLVQLTANGLLGQTATNTVQLSGTVFANNSTPQLALPIPPVLSGFSTTAGTPSASQSYIISGINLTSSLVAAAPPQFEISTNNINFAPAVTNAASGTGLLTFTNYVRIAASATAGSPAGNVTNSSGGAANRLVLLTNNTVASTPALTATPTALTNFQSVAGFPSSPAQSFVLRGTNIAAAGAGFAPVTITASGPFQVSLNNTDWATQTNLTPGTNSFTNTVHVRVSSNAVAGTLAGEVNFSGQGITNFGPITVPKVTLSGSTLPRPLITVSPTSLGAFTSVSGDASTPPLAFTVSGTNLLANILVAAPVSYEISTNNGASWTNLIALIPNYTDTNSFGPPVVVAQDNAGNYGNQTTYDAFNDFYVNVPATGGAGDYNRNTWIANAGAVPFNTGLTNPNTWGYAGGNFNGVGAPSSVGTYVTGGNFYALTSGGIYAGPGASYALTNTNFWIGYNDQYGTVGLPNAQTQIGKYTREWFSGSPNWLSNSNGTNNKFLWLQGTGLSASTDGLGAMLTWTAPNAGTFQFSGSYVNGNYGNPTSFAIVDSLNNTLLAKQTLVPSSATNAFGFTRSYSAGDVVQFQVGTPAAAQGSPLGLAVTISSGQPAWQTGANGGTGFGPWTLTSGTATNGNAGAFVGNPANAGIAGMSTNSFGLFANPTNNANFVNASRQFAAPLAVGQSFSFQWGNNYDAGAGNKGVNITTASGSNIFKLNMGGSEAITLAQGTNPASVVVPGYGTNAMTFTFARTASNTFRVSAPTGRSNNSPGFTNSYTVTNEIVGFAFYATGLQAGTPVDRDSAQPYFNNLQVTSSAGGSGGVVSNTTVLVRLKANAAVGPANQAIDITSPTYAEPRQVTLTGQVLPVPTLSVTPAQITGLEIVQLDPATATVGTFNLVGSNLQTNVTVSAPTGFQISAASNSGYANSLSFAPVSSNVSTNVFVRMANSAIIGPVSGNVVFSNVYGTNRFTNLLRPVSGNVVSWVERNPNGILVTNPPVPTSTGLSNYLYQGLAGINLSVTNLTWYNSSTDQTNVFAFGTNWSVSVPLAMGDNFVSFYGQFPTSPVETNVANDAPSTLSGPYANGWLNGQSNGTGFGPWQLTASSALADFLILDRFDFGPGSNNINYGNNQFFSAFTLRADLGASAVAYRPLNTPVSGLGGVVEILFDSNDLQPGVQTSSSAGVAFVGTNRAPMVRFFAFSAGGAPVFRIADKLPAYTLTNWAYTTNGYSLRFETLTGNRYKLTAVGLGVTNTHTGDLPTGARITGLEFFNNTAGPSPACNFYIGSIQQFSTSFTLADAEAMAPVVVRLAGAAAAYDPWAQSYGLSPNGNGAAGADPDGDGFVNEMEFAFGTSPVAANSSMQTVQQSGNNLVFKFLARRTGVTYGVQSKANLVAGVPGWAVAPNVLIDFDGDQTGSFDKANYERRTFSVPVGSQNFFRIQALIGN